MSVLSYQSIKAYCIIHGMIYPWCERTVSEGMTYGLGPASYDLRIAQNVVIRPNGFVLCSTWEGITIPEHIAARVCDKSTWARRGLMVQNTHFDPGFSGYPTLELTNHSEKTIRIKRCTPICQVVFEHLDYITEMPYRGKYYNQPPVPVKPIYEEEKLKSASRRVHTSSLSKRHDHKANGKVPKNTKGKRNNKVSHSKRPSKRA